MVYPIRKRAFCLEDVPTQINPFLYFGKQEIALLTLLNLIQSFSTHISKGNDGEQCRSNSLESFRNEEILAEIGSNGTSKVFSKSNAAQAKLITNRWSLSFPYNGKFDTYPKNLKILVKKIHVLWHQLVFFVTVFIQYQLILRNFSL